MDMRRAGGPVGRRHLHIRLEVLELPAAILVLLTGVHVASKIRGEEGLPQLRIIQINLNVRQIPPFPLNVGPGVFVVKNHADVLHRHT